MREVVSRAVRQSALQAVDVYVPRRIHVAGIEGVLPGAGIVGTPREDEMVAIDFVSSGYLPPSLDTWETWVEMAAERHLEPGRVIEPMVVPEGQLIRVGWCRRGRVEIEDTQRDAVWRWIEAGQYE
jgi:hypothetical protein